MQESTSSVLADVLERLGGDPDALRRLSGALDAHLRGGDLHRFLRLWDVPDARAARMFGVSRQAVGQWRSDPPAERAPQFAALGAATAILSRHVQRERIPAVVRRAAPALGDRSLLELADEGRFEEILDACRRMFDLRRVQP